MEPITLCGAAIVLFGLWIEFEPLAGRVARIISNGRMYRELISVFTAQKPAYARRVPVYLAKAPQ